MAASVVFEVPPPPPARALSACPVEEQCAINRQPFGQRKGSALALGYRLASWEDARQGLKGLLAGAVGQDAVVVRLSNVKRPDPPRAQPLSTMGIA